MKDNTIYLEHILESIKNIESFMNGVSKSSFIKNIEKQSAVMRQIEIIGEAVKNLSGDFRKKYSQIQWNLIAGLRDKLIHHYFGVNLERVWNVIEKDIPILKEQIKKIKKDLEKKK